MQATFRFAGDDRRWRTVLMLTTLALGQAGCLNLRPLPPAILPPEVAERREPPAMRQENLSGALDGPTLRLAMRDLAVILDTLGRLEELRPDLKSQMLAELADADAAAAAAIVRAWRERIVDLQAEADRRRLEQTARSATLAAAAHQPVPATISEQFTSEAAHRAGAVATEPPSHQAVTAASHAAPEESPASDGAATTGEAPEWESSLESLLRRARDRAESDGPDAARARAQLAVLELLAQTEQNAPDGHPLDAELWSHLEPALEYSLGSHNPGDASADDVIRSLQVATELLRGPRRFQTRALAFCSRIRGFGSIDRVESATFRPGQTVLLYSEVEHFLSAPQPGGFRTRISSTLELLDAAGRVVWRQDLEAVEDQSSEPRRDYFLSHRFQLPADLTPGLYSVRLTLRDELAHRVTSQGLAFTVR